MVDLSETVVNTNNPEAGDARRVAKMPKSLYRYVITNSKRAQFVVTLLTLVLAALSPVSLELQRRALDDAVANKDVELLMFLCLLYLAALGATALTKLAMRIGRELISARMVRTLRGSVYYCVYTARPEKAKSREEEELDDGAVVSMLSSEVEKLGGFAGSAISGPLLQVGTLVSVLGYMFWVEPLIAGIAVALYAPQFVIVPLFQQRLNRLAGEKAQRLRDLGKVVVDLPADQQISNEAPEDFVTLTDKILHLRKKFVLTKNIMKAINNFLIALGPFGVIFYGGYLVIQGEIQVGVIVAFLSGLERIGGPIRELVVSYREISDAHMRYQLLLDSFDDARAADRA